MIFFKKGKTKVILRLLQQHKLAYPDLYTFQILQETIQIDNVKHHLKNLK